MKGSGRFAGQEPMNNFPDKHFEFEVEPKPDDIRALEDGIYAFNVQATGISDGKLFGLFLRDADGTAIGGVHGWTWGRTCYISLLFVPAHLRNQGYGTRLMRAVQAEAADRWCDQVVLQTHDFQASEFYLRLGFEIVARVNYPHGHQSITMVKRLAAQAPE
jgi:GNAT superfamily N-acetyltransferase